MIKQIRTCMLDFYCDTSHGNPLFVSLTPRLPEHMDFVSLDAKQLRDLAAAAIDMAETLESEEFDRNYQKEQEKK